MDGFDPGTSQELIDKRDQKARTFQNEDGTLTTRFYTEPVNYRLADGNWSDIDTTLVPPTQARSSATGRQRDSGSAPDWQTRATDSVIGFNAYADADPLVTMDLGEGRSIGFAVDGAAHAAGQVTGSTITYPGVRTASDVEFIAGSDTVKETLVLHGSNAPTEWRFSLDLSGLSAELDSSGAVVFTDGDGTEQARIPPGWMEDSNFADNANEGAVSSGVNYSLSQESGNPVLKVSLDETWLNDPDRVYPVRVDPSVKSVTATSGTYVEAPYNQNFSSDTVLKAGTYDGGGHKAAAFLRFSGLESALRNGWVLSANLALYNTWSQSCTARPVTVHPITSNWSESTTTTYPGPSTGSSLVSKSFAHGWRPSGTTSWSCAPKWETIKLGSAGRRLVNDWTHYRKKNYGLAVKASTSDSKGWKQFGSDDYPNGKPSLDVTWTKYGATYKLGEWVQPPTLTQEGIFKVRVTNQGQETWTPTNAYKLRYNLYDADGDDISDTGTNIAWTSMPSSISPGESVWLNAKIAKLPPATYTLEWTMDDKGTSRFTSAGVPGSAMKFDAVNMPPRLIAESPPSGVVQNSLTPTLWASGKDSDRYPNSTLEYTFEVCEVEGGNARKNCRTGTKSDAQSWAVPTGWLSWGEQYAWYVRVTDGEDTSPRPGPAFFTTRVPQPAITSHLGGSNGERGFSGQSGNFTAAATDASIPTVGPELAVTRTYNSLDPRTDTAFGAGWSSRWDMRITPDRTSGTSGKDVVVTFANGTQVRFGLNSDGTYAPPSGGFATLKAVTGGGWILADKQANTHTFDAAGRLTEIADGSGREQLLTYTDDRLTHALDVTSGRSLTFAWTGGHVTRAATNAVGGGTGEFAWTYTYIGDRLEKVCPPSSTTDCTRYEYTDGSQYRSTVLDRNPVSYWRFGESEGSGAVSEAPSRTGLNHARYRDVSLGAGGALSGTPNHAATFDGIDSYVELPEDTLRTSVFLSVELWFKTTTSGVILGYQDEPLGDGRPEQWSPVLNVDVDGKLRGQFWTGTQTSATPIKSSTTVTDDAWHHVVLSGAGTTQALFLDGVKIGTLDGPIAHKNRSYAYVGAGFASINWDGQGEGTRYFTGQIDEVAVYDHPLGEPAVSEHYQARAAAGKLVKTTLPSGRTAAQVNYDPDSERVTEVTDRNGGLWKVSKPSYASGSAAYSNAVLGTGPTGYWRLGDRSGASAVTALDGGVDGSYADGVGLGSPGAFADGDDTAATFDGSSDSYAELPEDLLDATTSPTVELWFRTGKPGVLVGFQDGPIGEAPTEWSPILNVDVDGKLRGQFWTAEQTSATPMKSSKTVTDNEWHHAVLSGAGTTQSLYLDGVAVGSLSGTIDAKTRSLTYLGGGYASPGWDGAPQGTRYFTGQIDEVAVYDSTLDADTVREHFAARNAQVTGDGDHYRGSVTGDAPAGFWHLDETDGTTAVSTVAANEGAGTYSNATLGTSGVFGVGDGAAAQLSGNGSVSVPGTMLAGKTELAAELWFRTAEPGILLGFQNAPLGSTPTQWSPVLNVDVDGKLRGQFWTSEQTGATPIKSVEAVTDNAWHHVVLSGSGTTQQLYLDGVQLGSLDGTINHKNRDHAYFGAGYASVGWDGLPEGTRYLTGQIDEAAIYHHALTADQVANHYAARTDSAASALSATVGVTDPKGHTTSTSYDALRGMRRTAERDPQGGLTTYAYDTGGFPHTVTDPNGHATITGHDFRGNPVSMTTCRDADSCWTSFTDYYLNENDDLDPRNDKPVAVRDARSTSPGDDRFKTAFTFTGLGLPLTTLLPDGRTSATTYTAGTEAAVGGGTTPQGLVASETTPGGAVSTYTYFANGDLAAVTSPSGLVTEFTYDGIGRKLTETQISDAHPDGVTTSYTHDSQSRLTSQTGPGVDDEVGGATHTAKAARTYDADGHVLTSSIEDLTGGDPKRTTTYHYDEHGLNDTTTDAEGGTTSFTHDGLGRVISQTDAGSNVLTYSYTSRGQHAETVLKDWTGDPSGGEARDLVLESRAYDPAGRLASVTDAIGATTAYTYFDDGLPATTTAKDVTQSDGTEHDIVLEANAYDGAGNPTRQVTGGGETTVQHTVDATGRVTRTVLDPGGLDRWTTYEYDADNRITDRTQRINPPEEVALLTFEPYQTEEFTYDTAGNVISEKLTDGAEPRTTTHTYDQRGLLTSTTSPRGNEAGAIPADFTTTFRYDVLGRQTAQVAPQVQVEHDGGAASGATPTSWTGYNTFGEAVALRDADGKVTTSTTDKLGRVVETALPSYTPPGGTPITATSTTEYDALGRVTASTDPLGRTTRFGYDQLGNLATRTDPATGGQLQEPDPGLNLLNEPADPFTGGGVTRLTWTPTGLQLSVTDPTGAHTEATYDELGRQLTATAVERHPAQQNLVSRYTWDDAGRQTASTTPSGARTTSTYNPAGDVLTVTDPAGLTTSLEYDALGRAVKSTSPAGEATTTSYDPLGNAVEVADYGTGTTELRERKAAFDADGNRTSVTSATGAVSTFAYDALGRVTEQVEPVSDTQSVTTTFGYDAAGNRTRMTDGRGNATVYTFNAWGLPESTVEPATAAHPATADRTWTTVYDAAGKAVTELLPGGVERHSTYDVLGRLVEETGTGAEDPTTERTFTYDPAGRITSVGTGDLLQPDTYTYNDRGLLLTARGPGGDSTYTYDADGNMTSRQDAAGTAAYGYDGAGRLTSATDPLTGSTVGYGYGGDGRLAEEWYSPVQGPASIANGRYYDYDGLGRLTEDAVYDQGTEVAAIGYGYDLDDRLTSRTTTGLADDGADSYAYDLAGRLTSWTSGTESKAYTWDASGNRTGAGDETATYDARNRLLTDGTSTYDYAARGTLNGVTPDGAARRTVKFDAFERMTADGPTTYEYDSLDRMTARGGTDSFSYDGASNNLASDGAGRFSRKPDGSLLATEQGVAASLAVTDRHTDLVAGLTPDGKQVTGSTAYDPFGQVTATSGTSGPLGYQSGWTDPASGNVNMAARWYQPGTGGFASRDDWLLDPTPSAEANRYAYGAADPLNSIDPSGHRRLCFVGACIGTSRARINRTVGHYCGMGAPALLCYFFRGSGSLHRNRYAASAGRGIASARPAGGGHAGRSYRSPRPYKHNPWPIGVGIGLLGGGGGAGGAAACRVACGVLVPPKPPIDQNPNNGPNARTAPDRPTARPDWDPWNWTRNHGWDAVYTAQDLLDLLQGDDDFHAEISNPTETLPVPVDQPGGKNGGRNRDDDKCDDGPGVSATGHAVYLPRERYYDNFSGREECRATGVHGLLDKADLTTKKHPGPGTDTTDYLRPPGYDEIIANGGRPHNGHLIPKASGGSGTDLRNLVPEYAKVNTPYLNYGIEQEIRKALVAGKHVNLSVVPRYGKADSGVPTSLEYRYRILEDSVDRFCVVYQNASSPRTVGSTGCPRT